MVILFPGIAFILPIIVCIALLLYSYLDAPLRTEIIIIVEHVLKEILLPLPLHL